MENVVYVLSQKDQFMMFKKANINLPFTFKLVSRMQDIMGLNDFRFIYLSSWALMPDGYEMLKTLKHRGKHLKESDLSDKKIFYMN